jgi:hypothetical protein
MEMFSEMRGKRIFNFSARSAELAEVEDIVFVLLV